MRTFLTTLLFFLGMPVRAEIETSSPVFAIIDFFPFGYSRDGEAVGLAYDAIEAVKSHSGVEITPKLMSVPRALRDVSHGKVDMLFSYKDPVMVPNVTFIGNIGCLTSLIIPGKDSGIKDYEDMHGKKVGFVGLGYFDVRKRDTWDIKPVVVNDNFIMLNMLIRGRIDAMIANDAVLNALIHFQERLDTIEKQWVSLLGEPLPLDTFETHFSMFNDSKHRHLIPKITAAIKAKHQDGTLKQIFKNYGSPVGGSVFHRKRFRLSDGYPNKVY